MCVCVYIYTYVFVMGTVSFSFFSGYVMCVYIYMMYVFIHDVYTYIYEVYHNNLLQEIFKIFKVKISPQSSLRFPNIFEITRQP